MLLQLIKLCELMGHRSWRFVNLRQPLSTSWHMGWTKGWALHASTSPVSPHVVPPPASSWSSRKRRSSQPKCLVSPSEHPRETVASLYSRSSPFLSHSSGFSRALALSPPHTHSMRGMELTRKTETRRTVMALPVDHLVSECIVFM